MDLLQKRKRTERRDEETCVRRGLVVILLHVPHVVFFSFFNN